MSSDSDSEDSDATTPRKEKAKPMNDLNLKIRYTIKNDDDYAHNPHVNFLQFIINNVFPNVMIMNKRHENLKVAAVMALKTFDIYKNHFEIHKVESRKQNGEHQVTVIQTIQTHLTLSNIKKQNGVLEFLKTNGIHVSLHEWTAATWDVKTIGFLTKFSPSHHPKELATISFNTTLKKDNKGPQFRLRYTFVQSVINEKTVRVPVYAVEVKSEDAKTAEQHILKAISTPDAFISFRMRSINSKAYQHAVALVAQHQHELRTIVLNNVAEEAYFVLEEHAKQIDKVLTVHHIKEKKSMRIVTYRDDFKELRKEIRKELHTWIDHLDPSDIRACGDAPTLANIKEDDYSNDSGSDLSFGIESLLSLDIYELSLFHGQDSGKDNTDKPISEITTTTTQDDIIKQQQKIIEDQMIQLKQMTLQIQEDKLRTETKINELIQIIDDLKKTNEDTRKSVTKQLNVEAKVSSTRRRPHNG